MELHYLVLLGFFMGLVTSISGGAGVFGVPAMIYLGIPPINALALNRVSDLGVLAGALDNYAKSKNIDWSLAWKAAIPVTIGAVIGANFVLHINESILQWIILVGISVGAFLLIHPLPNIQATPQKSKFGWPMLFLVGLWSGALGMAGATFATIVLVCFFGKNFLQARSTDMAIEVPETLISVTILWFGSSLTFWPTYLVFFSSLLGAWLGANVAIKGGSTFVRKTMIVLALGMLAKLALDLACNF